MKNAKARRGRPRRALRLRAAAVCAVLFALLSGLTLRIRYLQVRASTAADGGAGERAVTMDTTRGYIYDRALRPLVNRETVNTEVRLVPTAQERPGEPGRGVLTVRQTAGAEREGDTCVNFAKVLRYASPACCAHLIGYVDGEGRGVCGLEKAFDRVLRDASGSMGVRYFTDAAGRPLAGAGLTLLDDGYNSPAGLVLTVDRRIQLAAQSVLAASPIRKGAVVVLDVRDSAILALASVPAYDPANPGAALTDPDRPFVDRALSAYPVGSVFKPIVAAAALEAGVEPPSDFVCEGSTDVSGAEFTCFDRTAHGQLDLTGAVCRSCNTYFISLAEQTGPAAMLLGARRFGFGEAIPLTGTISSAAGNLPAAASLETPAALANLGFGQGELLATPLQLAAAYAAIARGGEYLPPFVLRAIVDESGRETAFYEPEPGGTACSPGTAGRISEALRENLVSGTGVNAAPPGVSAAGKTATAQTGSYGENGAERLCTWFCGFLPCEEPAFSIAVLDEDGVSPAVDCAPVFREIAARIMRYTDR